MSLLDLFKHKEQPHLTHNKVWVSQALKWKACVAMLHEKPTIQFVVWFEETFTTLNNLLQAQGFSNHVIMYRQAVKANAANYVFAEHYPLAAKEEELFTHLNIPYKTVLSALDEPLFKQLGGDKIIGMLGLFGFKDDEVIEHKLIDQAVARAQEKLIAKVLIEQTAHSQQEWLQKNIKPTN
jgi:hypothetical protein